MNSPMKAIDLAAGCARVGHNRDKTAGVRSDPPSCLQYIVFSRSFGFLVWLSLLVATVTGGETNLLRTPPGRVMRHSLPNPQEVAAEHERAGRKREAAALYEEMARTNAAARKVLSHRLVTIYAETGQTNKALTWAREVMRDNPDPQAYLAAVHARLGQWRKRRRSGSTRSPETPTPLGRDPALAIGRGL